MTENGRKMVEELKSRSDETVDVVELMAKVSYNSSCSHTVSSSPPIPSLSSFSLLHLYFPLILTSLPILHQYTQQVLIDCLFSGRIDAEITAKTWMEGNKAYAHFVLGDILRSSYKVYTKNLPVVFFESSEIYFLVTL